MFLPLNYIVYRCYSCFRQRRGKFFHRHTCIQWLHSFSLYNALYTLVTLFLCFIRKYLSHIFSYDSSSQSVVTLVYSGYIAFPYVMHLYTLVTLFFQNHQKIFVPRNGQFFHRHTCIQWFHSFSLYNALYILVTLFFQSDQIFFHRHTCIQCLHSFSLCNAFVYTCHAFFFRIIRKYLSQETVNFFIVTLVYSVYIAFPYVMHLYTLVTLFWCFIGKYLSQGTVIFSSSHLIQWFHSFSLCNAFVYTCHTFFQHHQKVFAPCILLCTACLSLFNNDVPFKELVIYNLLH